MENLSLKKIILEQKVQSLENEVLLSKKQLEEKEIGIANIKSSQDKNSEELKRLRSMKLDGEIAKLKDSVKKSSTKQTNEMKKLQSSLTATKEQVEVAYNKWCAHITNIENVLFCDYSDGDEEIELEWNLPNYKYHFDVGEDVYSPIFLTNFKGYCFQLLVRWTGKNKGKLGIHLYLHRGSKHHEPLQPFNTPYTLSLMDKEGDLFSQTITVAEINENPEYFTIHPGKDIPEKIGYGFSRFVNGSQVLNYVSNDMLYIRCTLLTSQ